MVVMPDADLDLAVEGALFSGFGTAGQRCTSLGTVIVHESRARRVRCRFDARRSRRGRRRSIRRRPVRADARRDVRRALRGLPRPGRCPPHGARLDGGGPDHRGATRARGSSETPTPACSTTRPSSTASGPTTDLQRRRPSGRSSASPRTATWTRRSRSPTGPATGCRPRSTRRRQGSLPLPRAASAPGWSASTTPRPAPKPTCPSEETASPATEAASPAYGCSTSSRAGSRMNWDYSGQLQKAQMDVQRSSPTPDLEL